MTDEIRNTLTVIVAVCVLALQFWTAKKPVETKIKIVLGLAELTSAAALIAAVFFLITTDKIPLPSVCALYNFVVQAVLFAISPNAATRKDILSIVNLSHSRFSAHYSANQPGFRTPTLFSSTVASSSW